MAIQENKNVIRVNIRVSQKIKKYFEDKSSETGVAQSALMALALEEYIDQKAVLAFTSTGAKDLLEKIESLKNEGVE